METTIEATIMKSNTQTNDSSFCQSLTTK